MATFKYNQNADSTFKGPLDDLKTAVQGVETSNPKVGMGDTTAFPKEQKTADRQQLFSDAFTWEPKYQHKFILSIGDIPSYLVKTSAKPKADNGEVVIDHINIQRKVKGKTKWNNIDITLYDPIVPSGAQSIMGWFRSHHESATGRDGYSSFYKKDITLSQLDGLGRTVEEWTIYGAFINSCDWGSYDWSSEDIQLITATLSYDYAFMHY